MTRRTAVGGLLGLLSAALAGCAGTRGALPEGEIGEDRGEVPPPADRAAAHAAQLVGKPYRYGGASPATGFDCSGLVQYTYRQGGLAVPRSTEEQRSASTLVRDRRPRRGDLLFFDQDGKKYSHVGIYLGAGRFVHAPSSGKRVRLDRLDSPYWRRHLAEVRRLDI